MLLQIREAVEEEFSSSLKLSLIGGWVRGGGGDSGGGGEGYVDHSKCNEVKLKALVNTQVFCCFYVSVNIVCKH